MAWPNPQSPAATGDVAWPGPSVPAAGAAPEIAAERANPKQELPGTAENSGNVKGNDAAEDRQVSEPAGTAVSDTEIPGGILLAFAIALMIAGIFVRWIVTVLFPRRIVVTRERAMPRLAGHRRDPAPDWVDRLDDDVKEALRKLLQTLDRQAA
jgi:hypothetical protein